MPLIFLTGKLLWFYPTASYFINIPNFEFTGTSTISLVVASNGVDNGLSFSNNTFFKRDSTGKDIPYKTYYTNISSNFIDTLSQDYSSDKRATIFALDKNGQKVWENRVGGEYVWSRVSSVSDNKVLFGQFHRGENDSQNGKVGLLDITNGEVIKSFQFDKRANKIHNVPGKILIGFTDNSANVFDSNLTQLWKNNVPSTHMSGNFYLDNHEYFINSLDVDLKRFNQVLNRDGEVEAAIQSNNYLKYFPKLNLFYIQTPEGTHFLDYVYVPWYQRISSNTLWIIIISIAGLVILILLLWILTMHFASKQIKQQKTEIERTTLKLIESEKLALLGTIAGSLAHELNSPLGAIKNSIQRILNENPKENEIKRNADLIHKAVNNSSILIQKFLQKSRTESDVEVTSIRSALSDWKDLFGKQYELLNIDVIFKIDSDLTIKTTENEFGQIINNLLSNAKDSLVESGMENKKIIVDVKKESEFGSISVQDNGAGFDQNMLKTAFEPFKTTKETGKGTGLGLWIVKQILDQRGGSISIKNLDKGSVVTIKLPLTIK